MESGTKGGITQKKIITYLMHNHSSTIPDNASYKHLSIKHENIDLYYKNKPRIFATVPKNPYLCEE